MVTAPKAHPEHRPWGQGSLREIEPGVWRVRISLGRDSMTGKYRTVERIVRGSEAKARRERARLLADVEDKRISRERCTVGQLVQRYVAHCEQRGRAPKTVKDYRRMADWFSANAGGSQVARLNGSDIDTLVAGVRTEKGQSSADHYYRFLRAALRQGVRWGLVGISPAEQATPPSPPAPQVKAPSAEVVQRVLRLAESGHGRTRGDDDLAALIVLTALTGARRGEVCALRVGDVDLTRGELVKRRAVTRVEGTTYVRELKAGRPGYRLALDPVAERAVRGQLRRVAERCDLLGVEMTDDIYLFSDAPDCSEPTIPDRVTGRWKRLCRRLEIDFRFHDLRHFAATVLLGEGVDPVTVAARLGHSVPVLLTRYSHVIEARDREAANILGNALTSGR